MPEIKTLVEILAKKNRRNPSVFTDMVAGLACIRHRQRDKEPGEDGEMILYAACQDYVDAAEVFNHHAAYLNCRLDPSERAVVRYLMSLKEEAATIGDIHNFLKLTFPNDGWSDIGTRRLILGRKDRDTGGLLEKCADIEPIDGYTKSGRPVRRYKWTGTMAAFELYDTGTGVKVSSPEEKGMDRGLPIFSHLFPKVGKPQNDNNGCIIHPNLPNIPKNTEDGKKEEMKDTPSSKNNSLLGDGKSGKLEKISAVNTPGNVDPIVGPSLGKPGKTWENQIDIEIQEGLQRRAEKEERTREQAAKYIIKRPKSYSEMISLLPKEGSTKEETAIFAVMRGLLARGIGPRIDFLAKDTKLSESTIKAILDSSDGIRKDDSSPAGIVVYLPSEALA